MRNDDMKRRDFNRFALGIGLSPILAEALLVGQAETLAQEAVSAMLEIEDIQYIF